MAKVVVTSKWDGELTYTWKWHLRKFRIKLKRSMQSAFKTYSNKLFRSFRAKGIGGNSVEFVSHLPYAGPQEFGANIPARFPVNVLAMKWQGAAGVVFAKSARAFKLEPSPYLEPAIKEWALDDTTVEWTGDKK